MCLSRPEGFAGSGQGLSAAASLAVRSGMETKAAFGTFFAHENVLSIQKRKIICF